MKRISLGLLLVLMTSLFLVACNKKETVSEESGEQKIVVGISLPTQREARWVRDKEAFEAYADELGIEIKMAVSDTDINQQTSQVENLLNQGIDVLILAPTDGAAVSLLVESAHADGVPVISYDRLILNADVDLYVSFNNEKVGELQGEFLTSMVPEGNYIVLAGAPTDNNATLFKKGAMTYIQPLVDNGSVNIVTDLAVDNWLPANALNIVENSLTANANNVQGILAPNDGTAGGAISALTAQGLEGTITVTGQDAELPGLKRILEGTQSMTVFKNTTEEAKAAFDAALLLAKGETIETEDFVNNKTADIPSVLLAPLVITKDNLNEVIDAGFYTMEDLHGAE